MTVTDVQKDTDSLTMTITSEFPAPIEQVWRLWADPRRLERWWGPPTYPATFEEHDLTPGGSMTYFMTGPEGEKHRGWWRVTAVEAPHRLEFEDGFADEAGNPSPDLPEIVVRVALIEQPAGTTRMSIESVFPSAEAMEQLAAMGMEEGFRAALGQIDAILAEEAA